MTRTFWILLAVASLTVSACCNTARIRDARTKAKPDDPRYTIEEQQRRARDKYALPQDDFRVGPRTGSELPGGVGR